MNEPFLYDVFLSHSSKDKLTVRALAERLRDDGLRVWLDEWAILPGDNIPLAIEEGIQRSRILILFMSANAFGSDWVHLERHAVLFRDPANRNRRFIPLRLDDAKIPELIAQFAYLDWSKPDNEVYQRLLAKCRSASTPNPETDYAVVLSNAETPSSQPLSANGPRQTVALIYKRHTPHAQHLLDLLETGLKAAGYGVFIDRHLAGGVEWAQELKRRVRGAYAVVPLLSAESIWSEMVENEIQTAYEASLTQSGQPRLLPVRVSYEGPLPEPLVAILSPLQYMLWQSKADDERLLAALLDALQKPIRLSASVPREPNGGSVPLDSQFYIARPTDVEFVAALQRRDSIVLVKGARQMGKTSLLTRGLQQARATNARCLRTDFQKLTTAQLQSEETFFLALAEMIADQLDLAVLPEENWNARRGGAHNFERYLRREVLKSETPLVWALDEVDKLFHCSFGSDVFALFRSWHDDRAHAPDGPLSRLTMVIAHTTEGHLFITNVNQSPFNVGTRLALDDFTLLQTAELNTRYQSPLRSDETRQLWELTGGQPYLTRHAFDMLVHQNLPLETLITQADQDDGPFGDHLRHLLVMLSQDTETLEIVRRFLQGEPLPNASVFYRLRSGGLLAGASERDCRLRCTMYGNYLARHL